MPVIKLPNNPFESDGVWKPRPHQEEAWDYLRSGGKRLVVCGHRRMGKDELALAWAAVAMHQPKPISIWHCLPEQAQARKAIWNALDANRGKRRIDLAFPDAIRTATRQQDMFLQFKNDSTWQVIGSDNFDSLVGSQPSGIVYSEFALANPFSWSYLRPILLENDGWAMFISTPRGRNHMFKLYQMGLDPANDWLSVMIRADESGVFTDEQLKQEQSEYVATYGAVMGNSMFEQEYLCSWAAAVPGAYWGTELDNLEKAGRLTDVPYDPELLVITSDDLGLNDANVKFYWQVSGPQIRLIDVDVHRGVGLQTHVKDMKAKPYQYGQSIYPHDIKVRELGTDGKSRLGIIKGLGVVNPTIAPGGTQMSVQDGIDAFRRMIPRMWIDKGKCGEAFEILKTYHADWDEKTQTLAKQPKHDYSSNFADSCRYFAITPIFLNSWGSMTQAKQTAREGRGYRRANG